MNYSYSKDIILFSKMINRYVASIMSMIVIMFVQTYFPDFDEWIYSSIMNSVSSKSFAEKMESQVLTTGRYPSMDFKSVVNTLKQFRGKNSSVVIPFSGNPRGHTAYHEK